VSGNISASPPVYPVTYDPSILAPRFFQFMLYCDTCGV
jgi:hypothetical protein